MTTTPRHLQRTVALRAGRGRPGGGWGALGRTRRQWVGPPSPRRTTPRSGSGPRPSPSAEAAQPRRGEAGLVRGQLRRRPRPRARRRHHQERGRPQRRGHPGTRPHDARPTRARAARGSPYSAPCASRAWWGVALRSKRRLVPRGRARDGRWLLPPRRAGADLPGDRPRQLPPLLAGPHVPGSVRFAGATWAAAPSPESDWTVSEAGTGRFTFTLADGRALRRTGSRWFATGAAESFALRRTDGCTAFPEVETNVSGRPFGGVTPFQEVRGYVDPHVHGQTHEFLGGRVICSPPFHRYGAASALVDCPDRQLADGRSAWRSRVSSTSRAPAAGTTRWAGRRSPTHPTPTR